MFLYDGWNVVKEITTDNGQPATDKYYVWGLDLSQSLQGAGGVGGLLAAIEGSLTKYFYYDGNGNVGQLVNASDGSIAAHYEYDPFGNSVVTNEPETENNPYRFSTKYFDDETELYYYGYRYYSPNLGRWLTRDPIEEDGGVNFYALVFNDPINNFDYLGQKNMPNLKSAFGLTFGGSVVSKLSKYGLVLGYERAIIFFPATCEIASFRVTAGLVRNIDEWRPITDDDFPDIEDVERYEVGFYAGVGVGAELARFVGSDLADADSFEGIFHTGQGAVGPAGISLYAGDPDKDGGFWIGGTATYGPSFGVAKIDWMYKHHGDKIDLDRDRDPYFGGKCLCAAIRIKFGVSKEEAFKNY